jgi:hypothetical protein
VKRILLIAALTFPAFAQSLATSGTRTIVAHDGVVELFDGARSIWKADGVQTAGAIALGDTAAAVVDPIRNRVALIDLASGRSRVIPTRESPVAAAFAGRELLVLDHDTPALERFSPDGTAATIPLALDPSLLAVSGDHAYVYSRVSGVLQEISLAPFALQRTTAVPPFAASMAVAGNIAYLAYPRDARVRVVELTSMKSGDELRVGSVPVDIAFASDPTALTARLVAVADPAAKRVWLVEVQQSAAQAFARGFLRGLIGLGLYQGRPSNFPTGVDRVAARGGKFVAFDSSTGTLYDVTKDATRQLATGLSPRAFGITSDGNAVWWQNGTLVAQKLD